MGATEGCEGRIFIDVCSCVVRFLSSYNDMVTFFYVSVFLEPTREGKYHQPIYIIFYGHEE